MVFISKKFVLSTNVCSPLLTRFVATFDFRTVHSHQVRARHLTSLHASLISSLVSSFVPARAVGRDDGAVIKCVGQPLSWTRCCWLVNGHQMDMQTDDDVMPHVQQLVTFLILQNPFSEDICIVTIEGHSDILCLVTYVVKLFNASCSLYSFKN